MEASKVAASQSGEYDVDGELKLSSNDEQVVLFSPLYNLNSLMQQEKILSMRELLARELEEAPQFEELVGDIRLLRFLRANSGDIEASVAQYKAMLEWRVANKVNEMREMLLSGPLEELRAPHAETFAKLGPIKWNAGTSIRGHIVTLDWTGTSHEMYMYMH